MTWEFIQKVPGAQSIANLHICWRDAGEPVGFIEKPKDTKTDKNAWRAFANIGDRAEFLGHSWTKDGAKAMVEKSI